MMGFDSFLCHIANFQFYMAIVALIDIIELITRVISLYFIPALVSNFIKQIILSNLN